jgi:hypothetical protein
LFSFPFHRRFQPRHPASQGRARREGRIFTARLFIAWLMSPISRLLAGPLADQVLEPAMAERGPCRFIDYWLWREGQKQGPSIKPYPRVRSIYY